MSVAQRSDGRFVVKFKDETGRWRQRSFRSEAEAMQFDGDCQYDETENERLTVLEAVLVYLKNNPLSASSVQQHRFCVLGHDRKDGTHAEGPAEVLASRFVDTLTRRDLETFRENCRARGMKNSSINRLAGSCLNAAFTWCVQEGLLHENPWAKFRGLPVQTVHMDGTPEDLRRIYDVLPPWMQWACRTAMALCLRPGVAELFSLRWSAFNWAGRSVAVFMGKVGSAKTVFPPEDYLAEARARFEADGRDPGRLVCRSRRDGQVRKKTYSSAWDRACRLAGVRIPMYSIRHIAASAMLAGGADLAAVAAQLGHKDITTTGRFYAHALPQAQQAAARALPGRTIFGADGAEKSQKS